jgi:hypothetical protein
MIDKNTGNGLRQEIAKLLPTSVDVAREGPQTVGFNNLQLSNNY